MHSRGGEACAVQVQGSGEECAARVQRGGRSAAWVAPPGGVNQTVESADQEARGW